MTDSGASPRTNGLWAVGQQLVTLALTGVFSIVLVRFVSVAEFGVYSYATSVASLGAAIMAGGLQGLAIREFRHNPDRSQLILASLFFIREVMALAVYLILAGFTLLTSGSPVTAVTLVALLAVLARVLDAPELWFQAGLRTKTPAVLRMSTAMVFFCVRLVLLIWAPSVMGLIVLFVLEQVLNGVLISAQYWRKSRSFPLKRFDAGYTRQLASNATPLALSGIANQINLRSDILILQAISGSTSVGLYSAAARLSELLYVLPTSYMNATFPSLLDVRLRHGDKSRQYRLHLQRGFDAAFWFGLLVICGTLICGDWVVDILFGETYSESAAVLKIHVLACPFVFMAAILSKWIVAENKLWISFVRHIVGATLSIGLNLALIPAFGIVGSAWAAVISYGAASYLFCFFSPATLGVALMMSLTPLAPIRLARSWRNRGTT